MKNDSKSLCVAEVDLGQVKFSRGNNLGIDFSNQIDVWSKMEFKFSQQIHKLKQSGQLSGYEGVRLDSKRGWRDLSSLVYAVREKVD